MLVTGCDTHDYVKIQEKCKYVHEKSIDYRSLA